MTRIDTLLPRLNGASGAAMKAFVFDIETRPHSGLLNDTEYMEEVRAGISAPANYKDPIKIQAYVDARLLKVREDFALHPTTGQVVAVGVGDLESEQTVVYMDTDENAVLEQLAWWLRTHGENLKVPPVTCGFNIREFDIPYVTFRCAVHGVELPWWWPVQRWQPEVFDVMDVAGRDKKPLHAWLRAFSLPPKMMPNGEAHKIPVGETLREYCRQDVVATRMLVRALRPYVRSLREETHGQS